MSAVLHPQFQASTLVGHDCPFLVAMTTIVIKQLINNLFVVSLFILMTCFLKKSLQAGCFCNYCECEVIVTD